MAYNVAFSFKGAELFRELNTQIRHAMADALEQTARAAQSDWQEQVYRARGISQDFKDRYAASVKVEINFRDLSARIYSDDPMATPIETGMPARDMKKMLDTSTKVRVAKGGKHPGQRYLIIPFRHQTPGAIAHGSDMPSDVYKQAMAMTKSKVTGMISMRSGLNASDVRSKLPLMTMRSTYNWGGRLNGPNIPARQRGMVRMDTSSGKQNRSNYFTFRVMTENSTGWIVPPRAGQFIVKGVAERARDLLNYNITNVIAATKGW